MALNERAKALVDAMASSGVPPLAAGTPTEARVRSAAIQELIGPGRPVERVEDVRVRVRHGEIPARAYHPSSTPSADTLIYFHGGGWVVGSLDDFDAVSRALALESRCTVLSIDYRLAPEHRFPAAADDAEDAIRWAAAELHGGGLLVLIGDSAGGNLAAVCAHALRSSATRIDGQVLVYPVTDHDFDTPSYLEHGDGYLLGREEMIWFWDHYVPQVDHRSDERASPLRAKDVSGLPPTLFVLAEHDPLRDDGLRYAERLRAAGVAVTVQMHDDMLHGFFNMVNYFEAADRAVADIGVWVQSLRSGDAAARRQRAVAETAPEPLGARARGGSV